MNLTASNELVMINTIGYIKLGTDIQTAHKMVKGVKKGCVHAAPLYLLVSFPNLPLMMMEALRTITVDSAGHHGKHTWNQKC